MSVQAQPPSCVRNSIYLVIAKPAARFYTNKKGPLYDTVSKKHKRTSTPNIRDINVLKSPPYGDSSRQQANTFQSTPHPEQEETTSQNWCVDKTTIAHG